MLTFFRRVKNAKSSLNKTPLLKYSLCEATLSFKSPSLTHVFFIPRFLFPSPPKSSSTSSSFDLHFKIVFSNADFYQRSPTQQHTHLNDTSHPNNCSFAMNNGEYHNMNTNADNYGHAPPQFQQQQQVPNLPPPPHMKGHSGAYEYSTSSPSAAEGQVFPPFHGAAEAEGRSAVHQFSSFSSLSPPAAGEEQNAEVPPRQQQCQQAAPHDAFAFVAPRAEDPSVGQFDASSCGTAGVPSVPTHFAFDSAPLEDSGDRNKTDPPPPHAAAAMAHQHAVDCVVGHGGDEACDNAQSLSVPIFRPTSVGNLIEHGHHPILNNDHHLHVHAPPPATALDHHTLQTVPVAELPFSSSTRLHVAPIEAATVNPMGACLVPSSQPTVAAEGTAAATAQPIEDAREHHHQPFCDASHADDQFGAQPPHENAQVPVCAAIASPAADRRDAAAYANDVDNAAAAPSSHLPQLAEAGVHNEVTSFAALVSAPLCPPTPPSVTFPPQSLHSAPQEPYEGAAHALAAAPTQPPPNTVTVSVCIASPEQVQLPPASAIIPNEHAAASYLSTTAPAATMSTDTPANLTVSVSSAASPPSELMIGDLRPAEAESSVRAATPQPPPPAPVVSAAVPATEVAAPPTEAPPTAPSAAAMSAAFAATMAQLLRASNGSLPIATHRLLKGAGALFFAPNAAVSSHVNANSRHIVSRRISSYVCPLPSPFLPSGGAASSSAVAAAVPSPSSASHPPPSSFEEVHERLRLIMQALEDRLPPFVKAWNANNSAAGNANTHRKASSEAAAASSLVPPPQFILLPEILAMAADLSRFLTADGVATAGSSSSSPPTSIAALMRRRRDEEAAETRALRGEGMGLYGCGSENERGYAGENDDPSSHEYRQEHQFQQRKVTPLATEIEDLVETGKMLWNRLCVLFRQHQLLTPAAVTKTPTSSSFSAAVIGGDVGHQNSTAPEDPMAKTIRSLLALVPHYSDESLSSPRPPPSPATVYAVTKAVMRSLAGSLATIGATHNGGSDNAADNCTTDAAGSSTNTTTSVASAVGPAALIEHLILLVRSAKGFLEALEDGAEEGNPSQHDETEEEKRGTTTLSRRCWPLPPQFLLASAFAWLRSANHLLDRYPSLYAAALALDKAPASSSSSPSHKAGGGAANSSNDGERRIQKPQRNAPLHGKTNAGTSSVAAAAANNTTNAVNNKKGTKAVPQPSLADASVHGERAAAALHELVTCYCLFLLAAATLEGEGIGNTTSQSSFSTTIANGVGNNNTVVLRNHLSNSRGQAIAAAPISPTAVCRFSSRDVAPPQDSYGTISLGGRVRLLNAAKDAMERTALYARVLSCLCLAEAARGQSAAASLRGHHHNNIGFGIAPSLSRNNDNISASTAAAEVSGQLPSSVVAAFASFCDALLSAVMHVAKKQQRGGGSSVHSADRRIGAKSSREAIANSANKKTEGSSDDRGDDQEQLTEQIIDAALPNVFYAPLSVTLTSKAAAPHSSSIFMCARTNGNSYGWAAKMKDASRAFLERVAAASEALALFADANSRAAHQGYQSNTNKNSSDAQTISSSGPPPPSVVASATSAALARVTAATAMASLALTYRSDPPAASVATLNISSPNSSSSTAADISDLAATDRLRRAANLLADPSFETICDMYYDTCTAAAAAAAVVGGGPQPSGGGGGSHSTSDQQQQQQHQQAMLAAPPRSRNPFAAHLLLRAATLTVSVHCHAAVITAHKTSVDASDAAAEASSPSSPANTCNAMASLESALGFYRGVVLQLAHPTNGVFAMLTTQSEKSRVGTNAVEGALASPPSSSSDPATASLSNNQNAGGGAITPSPALPYIVAACDALVRAQLIIAGNGQHQQQGEAPSSNTPTHAQMRRNACWAPYMEALAAMGLPPQHKQGQMSDPSSVSSEATHNALMRAAVQSLFAASSVNGGVATHSSLGLENSEQSHLFSLPLATEAMRRCYAVLVGELGMGCSAEMSAAVLSQKATPILFAHLSSASSPQQRPNGQQPLHRQAAGSSNRSGGEYPFVSHENSKLFLQWSMDLAQRAMGRLHCDAVSSSNGNGEDNIACNEQSTAFSFQNGEASASPSAAAVLLQRAEYLAAIIAMWDLAIRHADSSADNSLPTGRQHALHAAPQHQQHLQQSRRTTAASNGGGASIVCEPSDLSLLTTAEMRQALMMRARAVAALLQTLSLLVPMTTSKADDGHRNSGHSSATLRQRLLVLSASLPSAAVYNNSVRTDKLSSALRGPFSMALSSVMRGASLPLSPDSSLDAAANPSAGVDTPSSASASEASALAESFSLLMLGEVRNSVTATMDDASKEVANTAALCDRVAALFAKINQQHNHGNALTIDALVAFDLVASYWRLRSAEHEVERSEMETACFAEGSSTVTAYPIPVPPTPSAAATAVPPMRLGAAPSWGAAAAAAAVNPTIGHVDATAAHQQKHLVNGAHASTTAHPSLLFLDSSVVEQLIASIVRHTLMPISGTNGDANDSGNNANQTALPQQQRFVRSNHYTNINSSVKAAPSRGVALRLLASICRQSGLASVCAAAAHAFLRDSVHRLKRRIASATDAMVMAEGRTFSTGRINNVDGGIAFEVAEMGGSEGEAESREEENGQRSGSKKDADECSVDVVAALFEAALGSQEGIVAALQKRCLPPLGPQMLSKSNGNSSSGRRSTAKRVPGGGNHHPCNPLLSDAALLSEAVGRLIAIADDGLRAIDLACDLRAIRAVASRDVVGASRLAARWHRSEGASHARVEGPPCRFGRVYWAARTADSISRFLIGGVAEDLTTETDGGKKKEGKEGSDAASDVPPLIFSAPAHIPSCAALLFASFALLRKDETERREQLAAHASTERKVRVSESSSSEYYNCFDGIPRSDIVTQAYTATGGGNGDVIDASPPTSRRARAAGGNISAVDADEEGGNEGEEQQLPSPAAVEGSLALIAVQLLLGYVELCRSGTLPAPLPSSHSAVTHTAAHQNHSRQPAATAVDPLRPAVAIAGQVLGLVRHAWHSVNAETSAAKADASDTAMNAPTASYKSSSPSEEQPISRRTLLLAEAVCLILLHAAGHATVETSTTANVSTAIGNHQREIGDSAAGLNVSVHEEDDDEINVDGEAAVSNTNASTIAQFYAVVGHLMGVACTPSPSQWGTSVSANNGAKKNEEVVEDEEVAVVSALCSIASLAQFVGTSPQFERAAIAASNEIAFARVWRHQCINSNNDTVGRDSTNTCSPLPPLPLPISIPLLVTRLCWEYRLCETRREQLPVAHRLAWLASLLTVYPLMATSSSSSLSSLHHTNPADDKASLVPIFRFLAVDAYNSAVTLAHFEGLPRLHYARHNTIRAPSHTNGRASLSASVVVSAASDAPHSNSGGTTTAAAAALRASIEAQLPQPIAVRIANSGGSGSGNNMNAPSITVYCPQSVTKGRFHRGGGDDSCAADGDSDGAAPPSLYACFVTRALGRLWGALQREGILQSLLLRSGMGMGVGAGAVRREAIPSSLAAFNAQCYHDIAAVAVSRSGPSYLLDGIPLSATSLSTCTATLSADGMKNGGAQSATHPLPPRAMAPLLPIAADEMPIVAATATATPRTPGGRSAPPAIGGSSSSPSPHCFAHVPVAAIAPTGGFATWLLLSDMFAAAIAGTADGGVGEADAAAFVGGMGMGGSASAAAVGGLGFDDVCESLTTQKEIMMATLLGV